MSKAKLTASAVMDAAAHCDLAKIRDLLAAGAGAKHLVTGKQNAITEACFGWWDGYSKKPAERLAIVRALVEGGCPVEGPALYRPIDQRELELIRFLIDHGADVNCVAATEYYTFVGKGCTPLSVAIQMGHTDVVALLIGAGADVNQRSTRHLRFGRKFATSPILQATNWNRSEMVRLLAEAGADVNVIDTDHSHGTPLLTAIEAGHEAIVKELIAAGADTNLAAGDNHWLPLALAKEKKRAKIIKLLEGAAAAVPKRFAAKEQLGKAAQSGNLAQLKKLLAAGADVNAKCSFAGAERTALSIAATSGHDKVAKLLLDAGAKVDAPDSLGATPLFYAAQNGHAKVVRLLHAAEADANIAARTPYERKVTPLVVAAEEGHFEVVEALLSAGADARFRTATGKTPLVAAAQKGHAKVVRALIAAVRETTSFRRTLDPALWWAVYEGHEPIVKLLLAAGASPQAAAMLEGKSVSAIDIARKRRKPPLYQLLKAADGSRSASRKRSKT